MWQRSHNINDLSYWPFRWKLSAGRRRLGLRPRPVLDGVCRRRCCRSSSCYWRATFWPPWLSTDWRKNTWPSPPWHCKGGMWARWWPSVRVVSPWWRYAIRPTVVVTDGTTGPRQFAVTADERPVKRGRTTPWPARAHAVYATSFRDFCGWNILNDIAERFLQLIVNCCKNSFLIKYILIFSIDFHIFLRLKIIFLLILNWYL